jgi:hypothetical protein
VLILVYSIVAEIPMKVLMMAVNFAAKTGVLECSEYIKSLRALPKHSVYSTYCYEDLVDTSGMPPMKLGYDEDHDVVYWWADLAFLAVGVTSKAPTIEGRSVFDEEVKIAGIDCLHEQIPVCYVDAA